MVEGPRRLLIRDALRHGVCGIEVVRALEEMWNGKAQAWQRMALEREHEHRGYPLARAVLAGDVALIRFLLDRGADPALKEGLAMQIAVKRGDVALCRMLYERPAGRGSDAAGDSSMHSFTPIADVSIAIPSGKRKRTSSPPEQSPRKRARTALDRNTRMCMTPDLMRCVMACGHRGVMDYFLGEMGVSEGEK